MDSQQIDEGDGGRGHADRRATAREMAIGLAHVFRAHDEGERQRAIEACRRVDELQFPHLDDEDIELASTALIDALWAKDDVEFRCLTGGEISEERILDADYSRVSSCLRQRAHVVGAEQHYATNKVEAWRQHKAGGDYWSPYQRAQMYEIRAAIGDPEYPQKRRGGRSGPGPEPMRYVLASELHDMNTKRHWEQGIEVLVPYYEFILERTGR
ncbi:MAG: hypothetical protein RI560_01500 [Natronomonas sp.]|jgi:hypothetical protein|uniref:hypothetical protein n=1 Tax=Natronomonas sp. TaxID=2184060 RepID=UPI00286FF743|nr:hypothetical protein [Natronomonas sp.]MDR9380335.1 hypothetical protein [Natronomonas sp.]MDR9431112.1 hypothetical protein [Natronomonas sp.]